MARVICPFCLKHHDFKSSSLTCPISEQHVPADYVNEYNKVPPLWLIAVGFAQHGKTTYLAALTLMLENISKIWCGMYYNPLDQYTTDKIREMRREAKEGKSTTPTSKEQGFRPLLFSVYDLPEKGSRCLVMYDVAGEIYNSLDEVHKVGPAIRQAYTIWFLVSLANLQNDPQGKRITELFNVYRQGMQNMQIDLKGRNLIVIYTKSDIVNFPKELEEYWISDPFKGIARSNPDNRNIQEFSLDEYIKRMKFISERLEEYTINRVDGGTAFVNMVKAKGLNLVFCLTSALGESPDPHTKRLFHADVDRFRVLDPFLWAITLEEAKVSKSIALVIDTTQENQPIDSESLILPVWENLSDYGELTIYYLGQLSIISKPGQRPPGNLPALARRRLIGPILEQIASDTYLIVICNGYIIDLEDFYDSKWRERLLLISVGENMHHNWPHKIAYRLGDDHQILVDEFLRLYKKEDTDYDRT